MGKKSNIRYTDKKFNIRIDSLFAGWMDTEITVNGTTFWHMFDEALSDPTIDLMKTYLAVREYDESNDNPIWQDGKISWHWSDRTEISFQITHLEDDWFQLSIEAQLYEGRPDTLVKSVNITKAELLKSLDTLFQQILDDKGFPLQYPAGCGEDIEGTADKADNMLEEILQLLPEEIGNQKEIYNGIMNICMNAVVKLEPKVQAYVNDYRKMLETHCIPENFV